MNENEDEEEEKVTEIVNDIWSRVNFSTSKDIRYFISLKKKRKKKRIEK